MPAVLTIGKTELKYGYVYFLHNRLRHDDDIPREDVVAAGLGDLLPDESEWIASPGPPVPKGERESSHVEVRTDEREVERYKCSLNAAHGRTSESINYKLDLLYVMQSIPPFVNDAEDAHVLARQRVPDGTTVGVQTEHAAAVGGGGDGHAAPGGGATLPVQPSRLGVPCADCAAHVPGPQRPPIRGKPQTFEAVSPPRKNEKE